MKSCEGNTNPTSIRFANNVIVFYSATFILSSGSTTKLDELNLVLAIGNNDGVPFGRYVLPKRSPDFRR